MGACCSRGRCTGGDPAVEAAAATQAVIGAGNKAAYPSLSTAYPSIIGAFASPLPPAATVTPLT